MATEQEYDDIIAPMLAAVALKASELGMKFAASVEWERGESGATIIGGLDNAGPGFAMTALAARANGNVDAVLIEMIKRFDVSQSIFLNSYQKGALSE